MKFFSENVDVKKQMFMFIVDSLLLFCAKMYAQKNLTAKIMYVKNNVMLVNVNRVKIIVHKVCILFYLYNFTVE